MALSARRSQYRPDIDGLRALAVLSVLAYHAGVPGFPGGFVGVDVFYVISGYLITGLLAAEIGRTGRIDFFAFYSRRIRRLFPAVAAVIVFTLVFWTFFLVGVPDDTAKLAQSARYSVFGLANIFFEHSTGGYFDGASDQMPLLHLWSLGVEEQFYLVWPFLLWLAGGGNRRLLALMLTCMGGSLACSFFFLARHDFNAAFYLMPCRAWELAIGALAVPASKLVVSRKKGLTDSAAWLGIGLIAFSVSFFSRAAKDPVTNGLLASVATFLVILSGSIAKTPGAATRLLGTRVLAHVGLISYGLYLWHWPLLALLRVWNIGATPPAQDRALALVLAFILAELSLRFVESPVRHGFKNISARKTVVLGLLAATVLALGSTLMTSWEQHRLYTRRVTSRQAHELGGRWSELIKLVEEKSPLAKRCVDHVDMIGSPQCTASYAPAGRKPRAELVAWGNSHAFAIFPMLEQYSAEHGLSATLYSKAGPVPGMLYPAQFSVQDVYGGATEDFRAFSRAVVGDLETRVKRESGTHVSVLLASRWMANSGQLPLKVGEHAAYLDTANTPSGSLAVIHDGLVLTLENLQKIGVHRVLVLLPYPEFRYDTVRCLERAATTCETDRSEMEAYRRPVVAAIKDAVSRFRFAKTLDALPSLCDDKTCPQILTVDGARIPVVFDADHPSAAAARLLGRRERASLDWLSGD